MKALVILLSISLLSACGQGFKSNVVNPGEGSTTLPGGGTPPPGGGNNGGGNNGGGNPGGSDGTGGTGGSLGTTTQMCGSRPVRVHVPTNYTGSQPVPVVVWFHGFGDDYLNFHAVLNSLGWTNIANSNGFIMVVPAHQNPSRDSFLYFNGTQFDATQTEAEMNSVKDCVLTTIGSRYNLSRSKMHWAGFSEGGHFVGFAASVLDEIVRNAVIFAGGAGRREPIQRNMPLYFIVGTNDQSYADIQQIANQWEQAGSLVRKSYVNGAGHSISQLTTAVGASVIWDWMKSN